MTEGNTLENAIVGAVVTALTASFVPFAPVAGGAVAGYLQGRDREAGLRVGIYAGLIAVLPLLVILVLVGNVFLAAVGAGGAPSPSLVGGLGVAILLFFVFGMLVYVVALSAIGGLLGSYLKDEDVL
jgi:hypothetical protein